MISREQLAAVSGNVVDTSGDKIGKYGQVYSDDQTGQPSWVTVTTGFFGNNQSFVPLDGASTSDGDLVVAFTKDQVKDAPNVAVDGHLSEEEEAELYRYYGRSYETAYGMDVDLDRGDTMDSVTGRGTDDAMTRSEERMEVGTERRETGRARLRKYVVTEDVTTTVPVQREEVLSCASRSPTPTGTLLSPARTCRRRSTRSSSPRSDPW